MFGLMRAKKCGTSDAEKHFRRMNYCGTCKTIGSLYSQKSRFLLNHDAVFLAEILTALSDENTLDWDRSYQSFNCLSLPSSDEIPLPLQFAATTNVILTEFKLADHLTDEGKRRYKFARKTFSPEFHKAQKLLKEWNFPMAEVKAILQTQTARESEIDGNDEAEILEHLAAPTRDATAIFFVEGVKLIGKNHSANTARELGFAFGKLIYLLDAFEDYANDFSDNQFNAIRAAFDLSENKMPAEARRKTVSILRELEREIVEKIHALRIAENLKSLFAARLGANLQRKLKTNLPVLNTENTKKVCTPKPRRSFSQRWNSARETARSMALGLSWRMPLVFAFVFVFALVAPAQTKEAKSARECFDLSFNLMFLGAIFGSVLAFPKAIRMQNPGQIKNEKKKRSSSDSSGGDSNCYCDGCCCGCEICDGCCSNNCDCCDGCDCCGCDC